MKTQHPPAPFMSLPHSKITLWDTTASSPPLPKDISSFTWSLLPRDLSLSRCPGEVSGSPAGHGPSSLFPSQAFLHAALVTRHIFHLAKPAQSLGAQWVGPGYSTPVGPCSQAHHKNTSHPSCPPLPSSWDAGMQRWNSPQIPSHSYRGVQFIQKPFTTQSSWW